MCGLSGFARIKKDSGPPKAVHDFFLNLFITSQLRGFDASGVAGMWRQKALQGKKAGALRGWYVSKDTVSPYDIYCQMVSEIIKRRTKDKITDTYEKPVLWAAMGHCRAATIGTKSENNSHPFAFDNNRFIGVHNGTITNAEKVYNKLLETEEPLPNTRAAGKDYGHVATDVTDSEIILYCIYRWGIKKVYPLIEGAWALVWWSETDNKLYFIRNYMRTLSYLFSFRLDTLFWSSEDVMLKFAADRADPKTSEWDGHHAEFKPHVLYGVDLLKPVEIKFKDDDFPWTSQEDLLDLRPKVAASWSYNNHYQGGLYDKEDDDWGLSTMFGGGNVNRPALPKPTVIERKQDNIIRLKYSFVQKKPIPIDEWNKEMADIAGVKEEDTDPAPKETEFTTAPDDSTCVWCGMDITPQNDVESLRVKGTGVVCGDCASDAKIVEDIIDAYPNAGEDAEWVRRWYELDEAEQLKGIV